MRRLYIETIYLYKFLRMTSYLSDVIYPLLLYCPFYYCLLCLFKLTQPTPTNNAALLLFFKWRLSILHVNF